MTDIILSLLTYSSGVLLSMVYFLDAVGDEGESGFDFVGGLAEELAGEISAHVILGDDAEIGTDLVGVLYFLFIGGLYCVIEGNG